MHASSNVLFPVFLKLENFRVLLIGAGKIGYEKITAVLANSPNTLITVVAPDILSEIVVLAEQYQNIMLFQRPYQKSDLDEKDFVIVAAGDKELAKKIKTDAGERKLLTNVADTPELCDFYLGSIVMKGDLKIAISTNGKSPTIAKRVKEVLDDTFPDDTQRVLDNIHIIRNRLKGNFAEKVKKLNEITSILIENNGVDALRPHLYREDVTKPKYKQLKYWFIYSFSVLALMISGHILFSYMPLSEIGGYAGKIVYGTDKTILIFVLGGFIAQLIDGALGMAYGVTATTFLLSCGIPPAAAISSVKTSEIFTSGASGLMHLRFKNVNTKLFRNLLLPGIIGAIIGAYILSSLGSDSLYLKPLVAAYTLFLGAVIILKAVRKIKVKKKTRNVGRLAFIGAFLDSVGGGGWGPIVSSTLLAGGRPFRYTIGSVNLTEFFITLASSITFFTLIGIHHWYVIAGLIIGGGIAAPFAGYLTSRIPVRAGLIAVGVVVIVASLKIISYSIF